MLEMLPTVETTEESEAVETTEESKVCPSQSQSVRLEGGAI